MAKGGYGGAVTMNLPGFRREHGFSILIPAASSDMSLASPKDMSLGEANRQKVKLTKLALNHLQEPRDIKIKQCKHNVSHFIPIIFYT